MGKKAPGKSHREGLTIVELMDMFPTEEAPGAMARVLAVLFLLTSSRQIPALWPDDPTIWIQQPRRTTVRCPHAKPLDATGRLSIGWRLNAMEIAESLDFAEHIKRFCSEALATAYFMPRMARRIRTEQEHDILMCRLG